MNKNLHLKRFKSKRKLKLKYSITFWYLTPKWNLKKIMWFFIFLIDHHLKQNFSNIILFFHWNLYLDYEYIFDIDVTMKDAQSHIIAKCISLVILQRVIWDPRTNQTKFALNATWNSNKSGLNVNTTKSNTKNIAITMWKLLNAHSNNVPKSL